MNATYTTRIEIAIDFITISSDKSGTIASRGIIKNIKILFLFLELNIID
jgi:hypothetical protein